jgi:hypothetical protein
MRARLYVPLVAALALSACGADQAAQAPTQPTPPAAGQSGSSTTAFGPTAPGETTGTVGGAPSTAAPANTAALSAGAAPATLQPFQGRTFSAGPISVQLNSDNTFVMGEVEGSRRVEGRYTYQDGVVIFSDPKGDIGPAQFPMRCRVQGTASEFRLAEAGGTCTRFQDLTFRPAAG